MNFHFILLQTQAVDEQGMSFIETSFSVERMKWEQERTSYELALQNAEKKIEQLQRNLRIERSQGLAASGTSPWVADKELVGFIPYLNIYAIIYSATGNYSSKQLIKIIHNLS